MNKIQIYIGCTFVQTQKNYIEIILITSLSNF